MWKVIRHRGWPKRFQVTAALYDHGGGNRVAGQIVIGLRIGADDSKIKSLIVSLNGVDIAKELENASLMAAAPASGNAHAEKKEEAKPKEEKKEAAAEGLSALFG